MKSFRQHAVAAAFAFATVAAGSAPAFAWGAAGAPDNAYAVYYDHPAQVKPQPRAYYNYVAPRQNRHSTVTQDPRSGSNVSANEGSTPPIGGWW
jgi:hypothetical protein